MPKNPPVGAMSSPFGNWGEELAKSIPDLTVFNTTNVADLRKKQEEAFAQAKKLAEEVKAKEAEIQKLKEAANNASAKLEVINEVNPLPNKETIHNESQKITISELQALMILLKETELLSFSDEYMVFRLNNSLFQVRKYNN